MGTVIVLIYTIKLEFVTEKKRADGDILRVCFTYPHNKRKVNFSMAK